MLQLQKPKLNDSARDRQRQRQKQRGRERKTNVIAKWHNAQKTFALKRKVPLTGKSRWKSEAGAEAEAERNCMFIA